MQIQTHWTLFKIVGIPVRLNLSVVLLAAYLIYSCFQWSSPLMTIGVGLFIAVVLLISIVLHELAHSVVAIAFGGHVRDITLQLLGGCAAITRMPPKPWQEFLMAFAGPLCSIVIAVVAAFYAVWFGEQITGWTLEGQYVDFFQQDPWWSMVAMMNTGLACFNLLPAFPMDGGRMLRSALQVFGKTKVRATEIAVKVGRVFAGLWVISAAMGLLFGVQIPCPTIFPSWVEFLWGIVFGDGGVFRLLIAYMIWTAGQRELDYVRAEAEYYGGWR
jgi:Zn-dependent protease